MDLIGGENKQAVIMGDINVDFLKYDMHIKTSNFVDNIHACGSMTSTLIMSQESFCAMYQITMAYFYFPRPAL